MLRRSTRKRLPLHSPFLGDKNTPTYHFAKKESSDDINHSPKDVLLKKKKRSSLHTNAAKKKLKIQPDSVSSSSSLSPKTNMGRRNKYNLQEMTPLTQPLTKTKEIEYSLQTPTKTKMKQENKVDTPDSSQTQQKSESIKTPKTPTSTKKRNRKSPSKTKTSTSIQSCDLAKISPQNPWIDLHVSPEELRPSSTLTTGQCFSWIAVRNDSHIKSMDDLTTPNKESAWGTHDATEWVGPFGPYHVLSIRETPTTTLYRVLQDLSSNSITPCPSGKEEPLETQLKNYFQLSVPLSPMYQAWSQNDTSGRLARIARVILGVRVLQQDPIECLFSFICSSNNNIPRITLILSRLRSTYGQFLLEIPTVLDYESDDNGNKKYGVPIRIYSFPTLESMQKASEMDLRDLGLGYRAKYIIHTRDLLSERGGLSYLISLRDKEQFDRESVQNELLAFSGIGRKVADCVALFSLDRDDAIPVDVHVWHIACRDYHFEDNLSVKSLTPTIYNMVGDLFRNMFEDMAGWAHSLLFVAELPSFRPILPQDMVQEMVEWKEIESAKKAEAKSRKNNK